VVSASCQRHMQADGIMAQGIGITMYDSSEHYRGLLRKYGPDDVRCLGWGNDEVQARRFDALLALVSPTHTVLDVGCGRGDMARLVDYWRYRGIDVCESMARIAHERYPHHGFAKGSIFDFKRGDYDWVVASGVFALEHDDWEYDTLRVVRKMYDTCRVGVAINFLVRVRGNEQNPDVHYVTEDSIDLLLRRLCRKREYLTGYLKNDITLILHRGRRAHK